VKKRPLHKKLTLGKKIIIAGGGTGGHIFPALAIAHALKKKEPDMDILFVGANGKMEMGKNSGSRIFYQRHWISPVITEAL